MSFEARNKNGMDPFNIFDLTGKSSNSLQVANSIKDLRLFVYADGCLSGYLTEVSSTAVTFTIYKDM